ncbi:MAG: ATP-binding protein, partial [Nitrospirota bacterium]|nr:ATP-binding protein [Nitrospirota bacterium]
FAHTQIVIDIVLETALVYITGGFESPFSFTYIISIMVASTILYKRGGMMVASLCAILYGGMVDLQYFGLIPSSIEGELSTRAAIYNVFLNVVAFFLSAILSSGLAETLKKTREHLAQKSSDYEYLRGLYENIFHSINTGLMTTDMEGRITSFNRAAEEITGYEAVEAEGRLWHELFGIDTLQQFYPANIDGSSSGDDRMSRLQQEKMQRKDGSEMTIGVTVSALKDGVGESAGLVASFRDLTDLIAQEERYKRQEKLAEIGEMSARMAHEIRNPLASLSGSVQILKNEAGQTGESIKLMDIAVREADRLNHIITEFLVYARPAPMKRESVDLLPVINEIVVLLRNHREYKENINIQVRFDDNNNCVIGDAGQLRQVFWNLAMNAVEVMKDGGTLDISADRVEVAARSGEGGRFVRVTLKDTGPGIPANSMQKLFLPFFTTKENGTGLGLAIVYRIVEEHGGRIGVTSRLGEGCCFTVDLPIAESV